MQNYVIFKWFCANYVIFKWFCANYVICKWFYANDFMQIIFIIKKRAASMAHITSSFRLFFINVFETQ